jgi:hypothetical protein
MRWNFTILATKKLVDMEGEEKCPKLFSFLFYKGRMKLNTKWLLLVFKTEAPFFRLVFSHRCSDNINKWMEITIMITFHTQPCFESHSFNFQPGFLAAFHFLQIDYLLEKYEYSHCCQTWNKMSLLFFLIASYEWKRLFHIPLSFWNLDQHNHKKKVIVRW